MISMVFFIIGGILIALFAVVAMFRAERERR
jgi:hypothetical protein